MIGELSLERFLELPNKIISIAREQSFVNLLSEDACNRYYYSDLTKDLKRCFKRFNDAKFIYDFTSDDGPSVVSNLSNQVISVNNKVSDKTSEFVTGRVDNEIWTKDFYESVVNVSYKLCYKEAVYFVNTFFGNSTEEDISEELNISRNTLQKIKKSCLVKMYLELRNNSNINFKAR